jgi:hypothetical protein
MEYCSSECILTFLLFERVRDNARGRLVKSIGWPSNSSDLNLFSYCVWIQLEQPGYKNEIRPFSPWVYCNKELKICGLLYHMITSDQPTTHGKEMFKSQSKNTASCLTSILAKERDGTVNKLPTFDIQN